MSNFTLTTHATAIGLHAFASSRPGDQLFRDFYDRAILLFTEFGLQPTYVGLGGDGYSGKLVKFEGTVHKKATASGFSDVSSISIVANPRGSDAPAYDAYAIASLGYIEPVKELVLACVINEAIAPFGDEHVEHLIRSFVRIGEWYGGYSFRDGVDRHPELLILGLNNGKLSTDEERDLEAWYSTPVEGRMRQIRGVFPYIVVPEGTLTREVEPGIALRDFILQNGMSLKRIADYPLFLWKVLVSRSASVTDALRGTGILIGH